MSRTNLRYHLVQMNNTFSHKSFPVVLAGYLFKFDQNDGDISDIFLFSKSKGVKNFEKLNQSNQFKSF